MPAPPPQLVPVGTIEFDMGAVRVERQHWVGADGGRVLRQLIVQREWFIEPGRTYRWSVDHPGELAGATWEHGVYAWSVAAYAADAGAEVAQTAALLAARGYEQGDGQLMARYARLLGDDRRRELIVFYQEDLAAAGLSLAEVADAEGELRPAYRHLARSLVARSREAVDRLGLELTDA